MNPLVSTAILTLIVLGGLGIILSAGHPVMENTRDVRKILDAEDLLSEMDKRIKTVAVATNSSSIFSFNSESSGFETIPEEDAVQYSVMTDSKPLQPFSRYIKENIMFISGADVECGDDGELFMENSYLKVYFKKVNGSIDTKNIIINMTEKLSDTTVNVTNSSFVINNDISSSTGTGYTEILKKGQSLPVCITHVFVDSSSYDYDVYFKLYSYSDFLVTDVHVH